MLNLIFTFLTFNGQNNEFGEHEPLSKLHESASIEQPPSSNGHPFASFGHCPKPETTAMKATAMTKAPVIVFMS